VILNGEDEWVIRSTETIVTDGTDDVREENLGRECVPMKNSWFTFTTREEKKRDTLAKKKKKKKKKERKKKEEGKHGNGTGTLTVTSVPAVEFHTAAAILQHSNVLCH
jgi:hypothetical protein